MFTGIVDHKGTIESSTRKGDLRAVIACAWDDFVIGESIAVNGVCLTVVAHDKKTFAVDISGETISCTVPGMWDTGRSVNLERALKLGDSLSGHMVSGHVDGMAKILTITPYGDSQVWMLEASPLLMRYIAAKGSVTLDGVSLTVNEIKGDRFTVNLIPHTRERTTLGGCKAGDLLNLEIDLIARYVERLLVK